MPYYEEALTAAEQLRKEEPKLCINCRWCLNPKGSTPICDRPTLPKRVDMVTGEPLNDLCSIQRTFWTDCCSPEGTFYTPKTNKDTAEKTFDWWNTRQPFMEWQYEEAADAGWNAKKAIGLQKIYYRRKGEYEDKYLEKFNPHSKPLDVSDEQPSTIVKGILV